VVVLVVEHVARSCGGRRGERERGEDEYGGGDG